ncbi:MAG: HEAT repeat domain-containing protein, partial [Planctomycetes bacterium]|nr:HEAT repeat domain-containing protein [Planctomycetota bacterium]
MKRRAGKVRGARCRAAFILAAAMALWAASCSNPGARVVAPEEHRTLLDEIRAREAVRAEDLDFFGAALAHASAHVRAAAARALGRLQAPGGAALLAAAAERPEESQAVLAEIGFALGQIHDPAALGTLETLLLHENERVRAAAVEAIGKLAPPFSRDPHAIIAPALSDGDWGVRSAAALACGRRGDARAIAPLADALDAAAR